MLYVGKATDLRSRVRSYFSGDSRRKVGQLLREVHSIDHQVCTSTLEAAVTEVRLIHEHQPRFNRQAKDWSRYRYLKLTLGEAFPRLSVVRAVRDDGALYLGPLTSTTQARRVAEAIESAVPLRRCTATPGRNARSGPCAPAQLGVASCPCAGTITPERYRARRRTGGASDCVASRGACSSRSSDGCTRWPPSSGSRRRPTCARRAAALARALAPPTPDRRARSAPAAS